MICGGPISAFEFSIYAGGRYIFINSCCSFECSKVLKPCASHFSCMHWRSHGGCQLADSFVYELVCTYLFFSSCVQDTSFRASWSIWSVRFYFIGMTYILPNPFFFSKTKQQKKHTCLGVFSYDHSHSILHGNFVEFSRTVNPMWVLRLHSYVLYLMLGYLFDKLREENIWLSSFEMGVPVVNLQRFSTGFTHWGLYSTYFAKVHIES